MSGQTGKSANPMIDQLVGELDPVRGFRLRDGLALAAIALVVTLAIIQFVFGMWFEGMSGGASPYFFIVNGLLLVLGLASTVAALGIASPRVGNRHEGPKWAMAMAAVMPLAAFLTLLGDEHASPLADQWGPLCLMAALGSSLLIAAGLVVWLKRGAPVSTRAAGFHVGVASTALGTASYGLACHIDGIMHLGLWHAAPVVIGALVGRFALPPLLRW